MTHKNSCLMPLTRSAVPSNNRWRVRDGFLLGASGAEELCPSAPRAGASGRPLNFTVGGRRACGRFCAP